MSKIETVKMVFGTAEEFNRVVTKAIWDHVGRATSPQDLFSIYQGLHQCLAGSVGLIRRLMQVRFEGEVTFDLDSKLEAEFCEMLRKGAEHADMHINEIPHGDQW